MRNDSECDPDTGMERNSEHHSTVWGMCILVPACIVILVVLVVLMCHGGGT